MCKLKNKILKEAKNAKKITFLDHFWTKKGHL